MSEIRKEIGKIERIELAEEDGRIGIWFTLSGKGWGCGDFWGDWSTPRSAHTSWTEDDRRKNLGGALMRLVKLFEDAKVNSLSALIGKPIEAAFWDGSLKTWRILTEVL